MVTNTDSPNLSGRVLHIHAPRVTDWKTASDGYYGQTQAPGIPGVNQGLVDVMIDRGVTGLLGLASSQVADAWRELLPDYHHGKKVAIKANLNNAQTCDTTTQDIDCIAQPLNAIIRGLKQRGVLDQDIIVYDAIRSFPYRLYNELIYKNIEIHDNGCFGHRATFKSADPFAIIQYSSPSGNIPETRITDTIIEADYLINIPLLKRHTITGVTLSFKNHLGTVNNPSGMHNHISTYYSDVEFYNALVDLYSNPHIRDKTVLTIADGIYGSRNHQGSNADPWTTFDDDYPCSLLFSTDAVAVDCIMHDLLKAERGSSIPDTSNSYLKLAANSSLGVFESGDPWQKPYGSGYSKIDYQRIEML